MTAQQCLEVAGVMFVGLDVQGRVTLVNRQACRILGYHEADIIGRDWFEGFVPEAGRQSAQEAFSRLMAGEVGPVEYSESAVITRDGEHRLIGWHNTLLQDEAGEVVGTLISGGEITEQRRAEEERARFAAEAVAAAREARSHLWRRVQRLCTAATGITAEHELALVLQEVADSARAVIGARYAALGILDPSSKELASFVMSGLTDDEARRVGPPPSGRGVLGILIEDPKPLRVRDVQAHAAFFGFPPSHPPMRSFLGVPIVGRSGPIGNLYLTEKKDAEQFSEEDEALAVMLAAHVAVAVENARLYEEREGLLEKLRGLQVSRERFFAMINHEMRNALTAVHGWMELWLRKAGPAAPRAAREVADSAERAVTLLEDMLDLSRLDASKLKPRVLRADAGEVVREAVSTMEPAAERRAVVIRTQGIDGGLLCRTDPVRIRQILINLLSNAVRHSPEGGEVTVEVTADDTGLRFDVVDRGEGIPAEQQARIFEAFERAGTDQERGTGLGLTLSKKLAVLLGGDLTLDSKRGRGARFTLEVPRHL